MSPPYFVTLRQRWANFLYLRPHESRKISGGPFVTQMLPIFPRFWLFSPRLRLFFLLFGTFPPRFRLLFSRDLESRPHSSRILQSPPRFRPFPHDFCIPLRFRSQGKRRGEIKKFEGNANSLGGTLLQTPPIE